MAINKRAYKAELLTLYPLRCKEWLNFDV
jgi:hypothetical protein